MLLTLRFLLRLKPTNEGKWYFIKKGSDFDKFGYRLRISLIQFFGVEFDSGLDGKEIDNTFHELNSVFFLVDII